MRELGGDSSGRGATDALRLLEELGESGIRLWIEDGRLCCSAPADRLDEALRMRLRAEREALVSLLSPASVQRAEPLFARRPESTPRLLTFAQEALLPLARSRRADSIYHVPVALELPGSVDSNALYNALNALQDRHEALRSCFPADAAGPVMRARMARITIEETLVFPGVDGDKPPQLPTEVEEAIRQATARPFDLESGPLWRHCVFTVGQGRTIFLFVFHHLIFDGFSRDVFLRELAELLALPNIALAPPPGAPSSPIQCADIAAWERQMAEGARGASSRHWWGQRFREFHPPAALPGVTRGAERDGSVRIAFTPVLAEALRGRAAAIRQPVGALALVGAALALHRVTGQNRILLSTPLTNRDLPEAAEVIGYLSRLVPLSMSLPPSASPSNVVAEVARDMFAANAHLFLSASEMTAVPGLARTRINHVMAAWQERRQGALLINGMPATWVPVERESADFALALQFEAEGAALSCQISYRGDVLGRAGALAFGGVLGEMLAELAGDGFHRPIGEMAPPLISPEQLKVLLAGHPGVDDAAVLADHESGTMSAWVVLNEFTRTSADELKAWLGNQLGSLLPPIVLTSLAALPRFADGAVDLPSLRERAMARAERPFLAPQSGLERTVAQLWQSILWLERPVGRDAHFRDLGGHSLLAVRMLADLELALGRRLSADVLMRLGTVAEFAAAIESDGGAGAEAAAPDSGLDPAILARLRGYTASWEGHRPFRGALIVGRNVDGPRPPLFWCLQNETELQQLARYIGGDQPVFGMRSGHEAMVKSPENIGRLAAHYAAEIMATQPQGPLFIGGNCQAATIAFQIARQVMAAGREVPLLILHEKMIPERYTGRVALSFGRESNRNPYLWSKDPAAEFREHLVGEFSIDLVRGSHGQFFQEPCIFDLVAMIRHRRDEVSALGMPGCRG